jgi:two-component system response regulator CpxR
MPKGTRILLVEDNPALGADLKALLTREGYVVRIAADGRTALTHLANRSCDIIIFDLEMPDLKGDMLREILRSRPSNMRLPMIAFSSGTPPSVDGDIAYGFLKKPIIINELIANIERLMTRYAISRQRAPD